MMPPRASVALWRGGKAHPGGVFGARAEGGQLALGAAGPWRPQNQGTQSSAPPALRAFLAAASSSVQA